MLKILRSITYFLLYACPSFLISAIIVIEHVRFDTIFPFVLEFIMLFIPYKLSPVIGWEKRQILWLSLSIINSLLFAFNLPIGFLIDYRVSLRIGAILSIMWWSCLICAIFALIKSRFHHSDKPDVEKNIPNYTSSNNKNRTKIILLVSSFGLVISWVVGRIVLYKCLAKLSLLGYLCVYPIGFILIGFACMWIISLLVVIFSLIKNHLKPSDKTDKEK